MSISPKDILDAVKKHLVLLLVLTIATTVLGTAYAFLKQDKWKATQGILVRDEMVLETGRMGRFESTDAMQTAQETIAEIIYQSDVVEETLEQIGDLGLPHPPKSRQWLASTKDSLLAFLPTNGQTTHETGVLGQDIEDLKSSIDVVAPNGAPFGRTEMIYFHVKASSLERARLLNEAHIQNVVERLKDIRKEKYASVVNELEKTKSLAREDLARLISQAQELEVSFGSDIIELRDLTDNSAGDGHLARLLTELKTERRGLSTKHQAQIRLLSNLSASTTGNDLLALPAELLQSHPTLNRLRAGLVDAQLRKSQLLGLMNADHPKAKAAIVAEQQLKRQVEEELKIALAQLKIDINDGAQRIQMLSQKITDVEARIGGVAKVRTPYSSLVSDIENKSAFVDQIERDLTEARANLRSADAVSLISLVGQPVGSHKPIGPGKKNIIAASLLGGLMIGFGWIFVIEPLGQNVPHFGRRSNDQPVARRATDQIISSQTTGTEHANHRQGRRLSDTQQPAVLAAAVMVGRRTTDIIHDYRSVQPAQHQDS